MRWILLLVFTSLVAACGGNAKSDDPKVAARTKYVQVASTLASVNDTIADAVRTGLIKPRSETALAIDKARAVVRSAMDVWGANPDSVPYMNAALAALPDLFRLVQQVTGKTFTAVLEPRSVQWVQYSAFSSFSRWELIWSHAALA